MVAKDVVVDPVTVLTAELVALDTDDVTLVVGDTTLGTEERSVNVSAAKSAATEFVAAVTTFADESKFIRSTTVDNTVPTIDAANVAAAVVDVPEADVAVGVVFDGVMVKVDDAGDDVPR